jgi:hypothetical protein
LGFLERWRIEGLGGLRGGNYCRKNQKDKKYIVIKDGRKEKKGKINVEK